jgi:hypothetical protein
MCINLILLRFRYLLLLLNHVQLGLQEVAREGDPY